MHQNLFTFLLSNCLFWILQNSLDATSVCVFWYSARLLWNQTHLVSGSRLFAAFPNKKKDDFLFLQGLRKSLARFLGAHRQIVAKWGIGTHAKHVADSSEPKSTAPCIVVHPYLIVVNRLLLVCIYYTKPRHVTSAETGSISFQPHPSKSCRSDCVIFRQISMEKTVQLSEKAIKVVL